MTDIVALRETQNSVKLEIDYMQNKMKGECLVRTSEETVKDTRERVRKW
jgi:hypothetical protein